MPVHLRLVHAEPGSRVVEASAIQHGEVLAMALGEGPTAEEAENRARQWLQQRLTELPSPAPVEQATAARTEVETPRTPSIPAAPAGSAAPPRTAPAPLEAVASEVGEEPLPDPEDWSAELARIDLALKRIGWQREQEGQYLERAFGHPSRNRLTTYNDLLAYLRLLEQLDPESDPLTAPVPLRRGDLLAQSDALLSQLGWEAQQGRQFLERHLGHASRQHLNETQLLQFNLLLEEALLATGPAAPQATVD
jgi:hypothetical protein